MSVYVVILPLSINDQNHPSLLDPRFMLQNFVHQICQLRLFD
ncbi:hypothetical protein RchiOBHm_Chr3g0495731 [Rosa chinensis]|uniref:Uncharacterized protein n=1 Tax=Rosa chinensis TaxID=74649 RepID=A0A2P6RHC2_ROSCH|nr:hypothetical protein RchiOBHm_Chr3g0495731 [Rosa chinensis]